MLNVAHFFHIDQLSVIMMGLVGFVAISIASFSYRYLKGDRQKRFFYANLLCLVATVFIMVSADHLLLLFAAWATSNLLLTQLMLHKNEWVAAKNSSRLALKNFALGLFFIGSAFGLLFYATAETSIHNILTGSVDQTWLMISALLIFLGAMTQSALWPFHRWLTSSMNSPTPVSAVMHAGLVNGGGFILARFAPLFFDQPHVLSFVFVVGMVTALMAEIWTLMQTDIKRMMACSTMSQMGFMIAQCGLGLFPAAVAHLFWHGLFKAYLFLASGSAAQEKRVVVTSPPSLKQFLTALLCGSLGAYTFAVITEKNILAGDSTLFLTLVAMVAGTQFALPIVRGHLRYKSSLALIATVFIGAVYGFSSHLIEMALVPMGIYIPQVINGFHVVAFIALLAAWLTMVFGRQALSKKSYPKWVLAVYVRALNASQPHPSTVTTHRNHYHS